MPDGKLRAYYWRIASFLAERSKYLNTGHSAFLFPDEDEVEIRNALKATLVFRDGSQLRVRAALDERREVREYDYAYIYFDSHGKRVFQYDDAPHHPEISTHPHHLHRGNVTKRRKERVYAIDVSKVDFVTVVGKIIDRLG